MTLQAVLKEAVHLFWSSIIHTTEQQMSDFKHK